MKRIGLTGGIASGKSTVSNMIKDLGIPIVDADVAAREVVKPGEAAYEQIVAHFGETILAEYQTLNRKQLGRLIFENEKERMALNAIVHPQVRKWMLEKVEAYKQKREAAVVLDIPLLIESRLTDWVEKVIVVYVPYDLQLERLMERDRLSKDEAMGRIHTQMPLEEKKAHADRVIDNSGSMANTRTQLEEILKRWSVIGMP